MTKKILLFLFLVIGCSPFISSAQNIYPDKKYFTSYWYDGITILKKPAHLTDRDVAWGAAFLAATTFAAANDAEIKSFFQRNKSDATNQLSIGFEKVGNASYCVPAMGVLYLSGLILKNPKVEYTGLQAFKSLIIAGGITEVLKIVIERERPYQNDNPYIFHGIKNPSAYNSFPSGHTCDAFAMASVISSNVKNKWWNIPIYAVATGVGLSRINDNKHWASDVMMGAAIGYCVGKIISKGGNYNPFEKEKKVPMAF